MGQCEVMKPSSVASLPLPTSVATAGSKVMTKLMTPSQKAIMPTRPIEISTDLADQSTRALVTAPICPVKAAVTSEIRTRASQTA